MDRRYQVFVSSTYEDLREERREVMHALLALGCIPTGMELFPAADDDSWAHIQQFIAEGDYYVVLVGGRYGSKGRAGKSYTEMEYDHAVDLGIPTLAFLHRDPGLIPVNKTDGNDEGKAALTAFREKIERDRHAKYWNSTDELSGVVVLSMLSLMKRKPRSGWVRADSVPEEMKDELLRLHSEIESLTGELIVARSKAAPEGIEDLAQGSETTEIAVDLGPPSSATVRLRLRWDSLMRVILPLTFGGGTPPEAVGAVISSLVHREAAASDLPQAAIDGWENAVVSRSDYGKVINQMVALGLVEGGSDPTNLLATRWRATPYGTKTGSRLLAIKRTLSR